MKSISVIENLYDDEWNRKKLDVMIKLEIMFDDERNKTDSFYFTTLENFLQFGKKYKITFEEIGNCDTQRDLK